MTNKIKRGLSSLALISILTTLFIIPSLVLSQAAPPSATPPPHLPQGLASITFKNPIHATSVQALINSTINYIFLLSLVIAPLMILVGAFYLMTSAGDTKRVDTGKKIIFWEVVGFAIILFSRVIISIIKAILGG